MSMLPTPEFKQQISSINNHEAIVRVISNSVHRPQEAYCLFHSALNATPSQTSTMCLSEKRVCTRCAKRWEEVTDPCDSCDEERHPIWASGTTRTLTGCQYCPFARDPETLNYNTGRDGKKRFIDPIAPARTSTERETADSQREFKVDQFGDRAKAESEAFEASEAAARAQRALVRRKSRARRTPQQMEEYKAADCIRSRNQYQKLKEEKEERERQLSMAMDERGKKNPDDLEGQDRLTGKRNKRNRDDDDDPDGYDRGRGGPDRRGAPGAGGQAVRAGR